MSEGVKFGGLNLVVHDMEATLAFYRKLGVEIPESAVWRTDTGGHHVTAAKEGGVDLELDSIALAREYDAGWEPGHIGAVIGFLVSGRDAVDAKYAEMIEAGYESAQPPYDAFWGSRYAIVVDPDGNHVGFMSEPDPDKRAAPPEV